MKTSLAVLGAATLCAASVSNTTKDGLITNGLVSLGDWQSAFDKAQNFVSQLTTEEKITIIGAGSLTNTSANWTALGISDGPQGAQNFYYESAFSMTCALAMTWDKDAIYKQGKAVATEFYQKGLQMLAGPVSNPMGRSAWGGRNGESFGPDAYFNGILGGISAKAYQAGGVIAGGKHFILYEQETNRTSSMSGGGGMGGGMGGSPTGSGNSTMGASTSGSAPSGSAPSGMTLRARADNSSTTQSSTESAPYSSNIDDKTFRETYLWPWYDIIKAGTGAVMCAMTEVNNTAACEDSSLLMGMLKTDLGFPGMVWPDQNGQKTALGSATGGLDYGSSSTWSTSTIEAFLSNGSLSEARLNDMVIRNVIGYYRANLDNGEQPSKADYDDYVDTMSDHANIIRENGAKSIVLLKNDGALPLNKPRRMTLFGANAGPVMGGPNLQFTVQGSGPTYQGHLASDSGSAQSSLPYLITPEAALTLRASKEHTNVKWILNDTYSTSSSGNTLVTLSSSETAVDASYAGYAAASDVCLVFINALSGEGADRTELYNEDQDTMVNTVAANCNNTIVFITSTGIRLVDQWIENENVTAVLYSGPLGQESGNSITDVLYGDVNPSGRLIHTIAKNESDYNVEICYTYNCNYTEGNYIDYKYFEHSNTTARYAFGHGLSYTSFGYSDIKTTKLMSNLSYHAKGRLEVGGRADLYDVVAEVDVNVQNTGSRDGAEVPQLYIGYPEGSGADQPLKALRGFERVRIKKDEHSQVKFQLRRRDLSFWDVTAQEWALPTGDFKIYVGASSTDIRQTGTLAM
ncbi:putative beta-glucosidase D [Aureobasidium pullulans]|nr:putative beta-glucosidase D [Aureobasidium pullulans]THY86607.1 putative beta-glucosidase D [Aureobasidium pullulans]